MITVNNVSMNFSGQTLFKNVDLKFVPGNCYGIIGANGAGKSTFLRILSGDLEPTTGEVIIPKEERMSILKQDHFQYDAFTVLDTVMMGNQRLYDIMKEKDALYEKEDFTDEDGVKASELEAEFAEMGGWEAESDVSRLIQGLGLSNDILYSEMSSLTAKEKVKVLLAQALFGKPDIILLDVMLPTLDGWQVCREVRKKSSVPIIMITAKGDTFDKVLGLELGADDYIVKPFDTKEVIARIKAIARRVGNSPEESEVKEVRYDKLSVNMTRYELRVDGKVVDTPPKELELLFYLASNPNRVYTRDQLLDEVWGFEYYGDSRTIDVHIKRLREKLEGVSDKWSLKTVWGVGYKFESEEDE